MTKYIFLNLKRFDIETNYGGVNSIAPAADWGGHIARSIDRELRSFDDNRYRFPVFFPEAHIILAHTALEADSRIELGSQSVHYADTAKNGNFGAFTSLRTANSMKQIGCSWTIIGHSEERRYLLEVLASAQVFGDTAVKAVHEILKGKIRAARQTGLSVLYCIGETAAQTHCRTEVLKNQIEEGLKDIDADQIVLAYEPIWAIGPGKAVPSADEIRSIARLVKSMIQLPLVYGGGLKHENAASIGAIRELDGGLIALTQFSGVIGFYPDQYAEIIRLYDKGVQQ